MNVLGKSYEKLNESSNFLNVVRENYEKLTTTERLSYENFCQEFVGKQNKKMTLLYIMSLSRQQVSCSLRLSEL